MGKGDIGSDTAQASGTTNVIPAKAAAKAGIHFSASR